ncbi:hypothetical protein FRC12_000440 [Ceratobasidium sp. 428]|nr:hypothetical protein FRC12_000440 [Ceratobasidium sp. 428]
MERMNVDKIWKATSASAVSRVLCVAEIQMNHFTLNTTATTELQDAGTFSVIWPLRPLCRQVSQLEHVQVDGPVTTISSAMSASEIIGILAEHHCFDVTNQLDLARCERTPITCGGFGDIYRGTLNGGQRVAIKCARLYLRHGDTNGHKILKRSARELHVWSRFEHENVLELLGLVQFQDRVAMVSPWMDNGTLLQYISRNPTEDRYQLCVGISEGVAYLHQNGLVHGDIKSVRPSILACEVQVETSSQANILISSEGVAKISDFGCSVLKTSTLCFTTTSVLKLSIRWAAPEILDGPVLRSREADVYALGMTLLEAVTGMIPFSSMQDRAVYIAVVMQRQIPKRPRGFPSFSPDEADKLWGTIVDACLYNPPDRPSSIIVQDRVRDVRHRLRQSLLNHSVIDLSANTVEDVSDQGDDDDYDEWDEWDEYDEYDEDVEQENSQHAPEAEQPVDSAARGPVTSLYIARGGLTSNIIAPPPPPGLHPPKRAPSAWQLFFTEYIQNYKKVNPRGNLNVAQAAKDAGVMYKALTPEQKEASKLCQKFVHFTDYIEQVYKRRSLSEKEQYERELNAWMHTSYATQTGSAPTVWQIFFSEYLQSYKNFSPGQKLDVIQAAQDGGVIYKALTSEQKEIYKRKAAFLKEQHEREDVGQTQIHAPDEAPEKPISAYSMFLRWIRADRARVKEIFGNETEAAEQSVLAAAKWRTLSDAEKKPFLSQARRERANPRAGR